MTHDAPATPRPETPVAHGFTARIVTTFLTGNLSPLVVLLSLLAGAFALTTTPREEEPQIVVPLADVVVDVPGASAAEVESLVASRLEQILYQIDGVEYVYSHSMPHRAVVTVRYHVGEDREDALLDVHSRIRMFADRMPPQVAGWRVEPVEVDDVPIVLVTLWSDNEDDHALRRLAEELEVVVQRVPDVGRTAVAGGRPRRLSIRIDPEALDARGLSTDRVVAALRGAAVAAPAGDVTARDERLVVDLAPGAHTAGALAELVVAVDSGRPVRLGDVATIHDGPAERTAHHRIGFGPGIGHAASHAAPGDAPVPPALADPARDHAAVTLAVAKQPGSNAVTVADDVRAAVAGAAAALLPADVHWRVTRDHGRTADAKVEELLEGLWVAVIIVIALLAVTLGPREAFVVATAIPITFALTLLINELAGYSINRVTLFALTLALGLVVDDPIVDIENIHRHLKRGDRKPLQAVLDAVQEVRPPIILATLAVMVSFVPLFFITGMMGPYMAPMALNVPLAMLMSLLVAFTVTPWLGHLMLRGPATRAAAKRGDAPPPPPERDPMYRAYAAIMNPVLGSGTVRAGLVLVTVALFGVAGWLAMARMVPLKMLPFDDKNELQVVVDLPEGSTLERTEGVLAEMAAVLRGVPEVREVLSFAGEPSPIDFNGMVRGYARRSAPHLGDLRVNLIPKDDRDAGSHDLGIRIRRWLAPVATRAGATLQIVEMPPGPPVIATVVVEVRGAASTPLTDLEAAARTVAARLAAEPGVTDVDVSAEDPSPRLRYRLDRDQAALVGVDEAAAARVLATAVGGVHAAVFHDPRERSPLVAEVRLPRARRAVPEELERLPVASAAGGTVPLGEIGRFELDTADRSIRRKNVERVVYVFAEVEGRAPADVILDVQADRVPLADLVTSPPAPRPVAGRTFFAPGGGIPWAVPADVDLDWTGEGEWKITLDAFRDLGLAFLAACVGIYVLLVHETKSYGIPLVLMLSIPFTIIGILPGFWLLNVVGAGDIAGISDPVFFTATAMIGMIALAGIAVRNAILLIEFVRNELDAGTPMRDAVIRAGANRIRPIFLTAGTAMLAAIPITLDPIFSGLAWALIFGLLVSSAFTLVLVPMVYARVVKEPADHR